jgi:hypothetical protein
MFVLALVLQVAQGSATDTVLAAARRAVNALSDTAAVRAAGFAPIEEISILDRTPFQGEHWFNPSRSDTLPLVPLDRPAFVMFGFVNGEYKRVGIAYSTRLRPAIPSPVGLGGDMSAAWHDHYLCSIEGRPGPLIVDGNDHCRSLGGNPFPRRTVMVHVWTDTPNPEGIYGHDNPALPFIAIGLKPPGVHDLHDPERVREIRKLALAIGETYDARMPVTRSIDHSNKDSALGAAARGHRAAIGALLPALRQADSGGDRASYDRVATSIMTEWDALRRVYEQMAATPRRRAQLQRELDQALSISKHHSGSG